MPDALLICDHVEKCEAPCWPHRFKHRELCDCGRPSHCPRVMKVVRCAPVETSKKPVDTHKEP